MVLSDPAWAQIGLINRLSGNVFGIGQGDSVIIGAGQNDGIVFDTMLKIRGLMVPGFDPEKA